MSNGWVLEMQDLGIYQGSGLSHRVFFGNMHVSLELLQTEVVATLYGYGGPMRLGVS